jgi:hypothetical protein
MFISFKNPGLPGNSNDKMLYDAGQDSRQLFSQ